MKPWLAWLIVLLILFLFGIVKVGIHVLYENKKLFLELLIFRFKVVLAGDEKKSKKTKIRNASSREKKPKKQKVKTADASNKKTASDKSSKEKGKWKPLIQAVLAYWQEILALIGKVLKTPTLDDLRLELLVGGKDAENCAMTYGRVCAVIGAVLPVVENTFGIRKRKIDVYCCFDRDSLDIAAETSITVRIYEVFALVFSLLGLGLRILLESRKNKKAVQKYESSSP